VAQPSSLAQRQIDNLTDYIKKGGGALLFLDPFPTSNPQMSPEVPKMPPGGPFGGGQPPEPKGDLRPLLDLVGLDWPTTEIVWNAYNPHPKLADLSRTPEIVFIGPGSGNTDAFNSEQLASAGMQEIVTLFPGMLRPKAGAGPEFIPLLRTGAIGGTVPWSSLVQQSFMGISGINESRRHDPTNTTYTLAARLTGLPTADAKIEPTKIEPTKDAEKKKDEKPSAPAKINVIAIADLDLIGEQFFDMRNRKVEDLEFDNVAFVLNCVDVLAGDESFVGLRGKRPLHRRLDVIEQQVKAFDKALAEQTKDAENQASEQLLKAQRSFDKEVDSVKNRTEWDERTKEIQLANLQSIAQRRLDVAKQVIEDKKLIEIREGKAESERKIRGIRNTVRLEAALIPPLPPLILGLFVWISRLRRENVGANPKRLA
jgi:ABC-2 type transport system permease protein